MSAGIYNNSNAPWWGPGRTMIVTDPGKLTAFARANAVRAGVRGTYGAMGLSGLGYSVSDYGGIGVSEGGPITGKRLLPAQLTSYTNPDPGYVFDPNVGFGDNSASGPESSSSTMNQQGTMLIDRFFDMFNSVLGKVGTAVTPASMQPVDSGPGIGTVLVGGAAIVGGVLLVKKLMKKR